MKLFVLSCKLSPSFLKLEVEIEMKDNREMILEYLLEFY